MIERLLLMSLLVNVRIGIEGPRWRYGNRVTYDACHALADAIRAAVSTNPGDTCAQYLHPVCRA